MKEIRDHQEPVCNIENRGFLHSHAVELIKGVDLHELDASLLKNLFAGDLLERTIHQPSCSRISIAERWPY